MGTIFDKPQITHIGTLDIFTIIDFDNNTTIIYDSTKPFNKNLYYVVSI